MRGRFLQAVEGLDPGYFALVMATGIVSIGLTLEGYDAASADLLVIGAVAFVVLMFLNAWRFAAYRAAAVQDLRDPRRAFGYFTFVAGANVLGVRLGMAGHPHVTAALLACSGAVWLVLGYALPWIALLGRPGRNRQHAQEAHEERPGVRAANGTWFLWAVACQSVAVAAASVEPVAEGPRRELALVAVTSWSVGLFLYAATGIVVLLRLLLYELDPVDLTPAYWVAMGALAITVLAGARIVAMAHAPAVDATREVVAGASVVFWAFATWLLPALVAAGWWRHVTRKVPLRYDASLWSIVFPLGMYAVAGMYVGRADRLPVVETAGRAVLWVALAAWAVTFVAMAAQSLRTVAVRRGG